VLIHKVDRLSRSRADDVAVVLGSADQPMRALDIHATAEELLGRPIKWMSVRVTLSARAAEPRARFQRVGYGRYRIV
jgi:hypothetical protein